MQEIKANIHAWIREYDCKYAELTKRCEEYDAARIPILNAWRKIEKAYIKLSKCLLGIDASFAIVISLDMFSNYIETNIPVLPSMPALLISAIAIILGRVCISAHRKEALEEYHEQRPSANWVDFYKAIATAVTALDNDTVNLVSFDETPQKFSSWSVLRASMNRGLHGCFVISPKEHISLLKSIYGKDRPAAETEHEFPTKTLTGQEAMEWDKLPPIDELELPYVKVSLFPDITHNTWRYLVPYKAQTTDVREIRDTFKVLCTAICYDILWRKIQDSENWSDKKITEADLAPYFNESNKDSRQRSSKEMRDAFDHIAGMLEKQADAGRDILTAQVRARIETKQ